MRYRTIFLSDTHLGKKGCQAGLLLNFLNHHDADTMYLVGDIIDGWSLRRGWHWPQEHNDIVQLLLAKSNAGTKIFLIPGNHDEFLRNYLGTHFGGIEVMQTADFTSQDGRRFLVTHGDQFDSVVIHAKWLAHLGDRAYELMLWLNRHVNRVRWIWGGQYWSLSKWTKQQVKQAVNFISQYEDVLADEAKRNGYDGVICGHIHHANISRINDIDYVNTGDWVESCTAIVEEPDGHLRLIDWEADTIKRDNMLKRRRKKAQKSSEQAREELAQTGH